MSRVVITRRAQHGRHRHPVRGPAGRARRAVRHLLRARRTRRGPDRVLGADGLRPRDPRGHRAAAGRRSRPRGGPRGPAPAARRTRRERHRRGAAAGARGDRQGLHGVGARGARRARRAEGPDPPPVLRAARRAGPQPELGGDRLPRPARRAAVRRAGAEDDRRHAPRLGHAHADRRRRGHRVRLRRRRRRGAPRDAREGRRRPRGRRVLQRGRLQPARAVGLREPLPRGRHVRHAGRAHRPDDGLRAGRRLDRQLDELPAHLPVGARAVGGRVRSRGPRGRGLRPHPRHGQRTDQRHRRMLGLEPEHGDAEGRLRGARPRLPADHAQRRRGRPTTPTWPG